MGTITAASNGGSAIAIRLFGGFELSVDGVVRPRPRTQVRQLLAIGALSRMSVDSVIDQLWPVELPADPRRAFRVVASRCRSALDPHREALRTDANMVHLEADCDVVRYQRLVAGAGTPNPDGAEARRLAELDQAFLIRSDLPLDTCDNLACLVTLDSELATNARSAALEAAPLLVAAGRAREAAETLHPMWTASQTDEAIGLALAHALANNSQRAQALEILDQTRVALRDEHGLNLGAAADALLNELLRDGYGVDPVGSFALAKPSRVPIVGMRRIMRDLSIDEGDVTVVEGYAGDGKSTVATEIEHRWAERGKTVLRIEAPTHPTRPMQVVAETITELIERQILDPVGLDDQTAVAVRRLVHDLPGVSNHFAVTRESLIVLLAKLIATTLDGNNGALLVDDLQFCDWASIEVLRGVVELARHPIVLTTRVSRPAYVDELISHQRCSVTRLTGLKHSEVAELTERCLRGRRVDLDSLYARSGGHPLFVNLLIGLLIDGDVGDDLPSTVMLAVRHRTGTLSRDANEALSLLSLFPNGVSIDVLAEIRPTIAAEVAELSAASLLHHGSELRIRHAIVCEAVQQLIPQGLLVVWHDQIGWLLERRGSPTSTWVDHALAAAEFDPQRALSAAVEAASEYANAFAWERVLDLAAHALDIRARFDVNDPRTEALAHLWAGRAQLALSMADDGDGALLTAVKIADEIGDDELQAEAVIELCTFGRISPHDTLGDELHARIERLLLEDLRPAVRCELAAAAGTLLSVSRLQQRGRDLFMQGYREARGLGDVEVDRRVLVHLYLALGHPADLATKLDGARRLNAIAGSDPDLVWQAKYLDFGIGLMTANRDLIDASIVELRDLAPRLRLRDRTFGLTFTEASYAKVVGDLERAERLAIEAGDLGRRRFPEKWVMFVVMAILVAITEQRGEMGALLPFAESRIDFNPTFPIWHVIAAAAAADLGDEDRVRVELAHLRATDFHIVPDLSWSAAVAMLAPPVALVRDVDAARVLGERIRPFSGQMAWNGITTHRPIDHYLAVYDDVLGTGRSDDYRRRASEMITALTATPAVAATTDR